MSVYKANTKIGNIYKGTAKIGKIYKGSQLIYSAGYWLTKTGYPCTLTYSLGKVLKDYKLYGNTRALPNEYIQLEYIEGTGTQYINTGYKLTSDTNRFEITLKDLDTSAMYCTFGTRAGATFNGIMQSKISNVNFAWWTGNSWVGYNVADYTTFKTFTVDTIDNGNNNIIGNISMTGEEIKSFTRAGYGTGSPTAITNRDIFLFANNFGYAYYFSKVKISAFKIWDNGLLVRDLVPAKNSIGTLGMYDLVTNTFLINAGSGTFVAGAELQKPNNPIKIDFLGDNYKNLINVNDSSVNANGVPVALFILNNIDLGVGTFYLSAKIHCENLVYTTNQGALISYGYKENNGSTIYGVFTRIYQYLEKETDTEYRFFTTFTATAPLTYLYLYVQSYLTSGTINVSDIMLTKSINSKYVPYKSLTFNVDDNTNNTNNFISLDEHEPLRKIDDVADYIDYENGRIVRNIGKVVFDGAESWNYEAPTKLYWLSIRDRLALSSCPMISSHFLRTLIYNPLVGYFRSGAKTNTMFQFDDGIGGTENFKTWLSSQYTNGTPVTVYYQLEEPTYEDIDLPIINTFKGTNILTACDEKLEASNIEATYKSSKNS